MSGRRVALRLALRRMRRDRRRTLILLAALVVPLTAAVALSTLRATGTLSPEVRVASMVGQSESVVLNGSLLREQGPERALTNGGDELSRAAGRPIGSAVEVTGSMPVSADGLQVDSFGYGLDTDDPIHQGRFVTLRGEGPRADDEVALSASVAERLGAQVGDEVRIGRGSTPVTVTGVMAVATDTLRKFVVTTPLAAIRNAPSAVDPRQGAGELVAGQDSLVMAWHTRAALNPEKMREKGWTVNDRQTAFQNVESGAQGSEATSWILGIAALVIAELGLILGAVYAIVVRSNRRELGLLASAGAGPKVRRAVITYQGLAAGAVALVASTALGVGVAFLLAPEAAERSYQIWGPVRPDPLALAVLALIGIGVPAMSARIAARGIAVDVVAALRDQAEPARLGRRRGLTTIAGVLPLAAILLFSGALLDQPLLVLIGALALVAGAGYVLRQVLPDAGGRADRLPLLHRIGLRFTARAAPRAAALGTVVASLIAIAGLILGAMGGLSEQVKQNYIANTPQGSGYAYATKMPSAPAVRALAEAFGVDRMVQLGLVSPPPPKVASDAGALSYWGAFEARTPVTDCIDGSGPLPDGAQRQLPECAKATGFPAEQAQLMAIDVQDLDAVLGRPATPAERDGLTQGKALVLDERLASGGSVTVRAPDPNADPAQQADSVISVELPALVAQQRATYRNVPTVMVSNAAVQKMGAVVQPNDAHFYVPHTGAAITEEQEDRANGILAADIGPGTFQVQVERGPTAGKVLRTTTIASIILLVLAAATLAFITVALATQEMRTDLSALAAAGADRRFRSLLSGSHAGQVTSLGVLAGIGVTVVATPALLAALDVGWSAWPWLGLLASSFAAISAAVLAGWFGGSRVTTMLKKAT